MVIKMESEVDIIYMEETRDYVRRAINYRQMDFNSSFCQMLYICLSPRRLVKLTSMRKVAKNQWARDDPAFVVMLILGLSVASVAFTIALSE